MRQQKSRRRVSFVRLRLRDERWRIASVFESDGIFEARVAEWLDAPERAGDGAKELTSIRILTAALAMETLCLDSQQQGRSVVIVVSADQPLTRLERIGVARIQGVSILPSCHAALQQALSHS